LAPGAKFKNLREVYRTMKKKILILMAVLVIASLGFASVVSAESENGMGTLDAKGDGFAGLHGAGYIRVSGRGVLWVKGEESIEIRGDGHRKAFPDGWTEYVGFSGTARIRGQGVSVLMAGEGIDLYAIGSGRVILWGEGTYEINGLITGRWSEAIEVLDY
jgi:hypothetical protein